MCPNLWTRCGAVLRSWPTRGCEIREAKGLELTLRLWLAGALEKGADFSGALSNYLIVRDAYRPSVNRTPPMSKTVLVLRVPRIASPGFTFNGARSPMPWSKIKRRWQHANHFLVVTSRTLKHSTRWLTSITAWAMITQLWRASRRRRGMLNGSRLVAPTRRSNAANQRIPGWRPITPNEFDSLDPN